jgi:hypothetical protein
MAIAQNAGLRGSAMRAVVRMKSSTVRSGSRWFPLVHNLMAQAAGAVLDDLVALTVQQYRRRNFFLILGFTLLVISLVLPAYLP